MRNSLIVGLSVFIIVVCSAALIVTSSLNDSPGFDEPEHITAGFYYVTHQTYWMNVYHPPLIKDLAGLAVAQSGAVAVDDSAGYKHYKSMNVIDAFMWSQDADKILKYARAPLIGLSVLFLFYFFIRIKNEFGTATAMIALLMLAFSPTFLANARFVGNDILASACFFIAIFCLFDYLRKPGLKPAFILGAVTGVSLLVKMSLILLFPLYALLSIVFVVANQTIDGRKIFPIDFQRLKEATMQCFIIAGLALLLLYGGYAVNMAKMNPKYQTWYNFKKFRDMRFDPRYDIVQLTQEQSVLRPLSWYMTGVFAQSRHLDKGHDGPSFLRGKLYKGGNFWFFPIVLLAKEPIGFLCLMMCALLTPLPTINRFLLAENAQVFKRALVDNFVVLSSVFFIIAYLLIAMRSGLNIGIRHVFPVMPFVYMLTAIGITRSRLPKKIVIGIVAVCLSAGVISSLLAYPGHLAYFNELVGGKSGGKKIALDSNYDWGIDLKRLKVYVEEQKIPRIHVAYFGRGKPEYYLGDKCERWTMVDGLPPGEYLAVSVQIVEEAIALSSAGIPNQAVKTLKWSGPKGALPHVIDWLAKLEPCGLVGDSILIYKIPK